MKIVITGATGFIGRPLVRSLLSNGHQVSVLSRDPRRAALLLPARVRHVRWNPQQGVPPETFSGVDVVIHLAGEGVADKRWSEARKRALVDSRIVGTRAVVDEIRALQPEFRPKALVSASAIGAYGNRGDEVLSEESAAGSGFLADLCTQWESEAMEAAPLGVRVAVLRVGIVLAAGGGALGPLLPLFQMGGGGRVGGGKQWMSWIHRDDMVRLFETAATDERYTGIINGTAPNPVTNAEFTRSLAAAVHRPALFPAPAFALRLAMGEMSEIVLASQRVLPKEASRLGFTFRYPELDGALQEICATDEQVLESEQWVPRPISEVFPFFADARNLEKLTPDFLRFQVLGMNPETMGNGTTIDYRLRLHGLPVRWQSRIEDWQPGKRFVDTQVRGPYALWHHTHDFEEYEGGTLVIDRVRFRLPAGVLGNLVGGPFVRKDLDTIFQYRRDTLEKLFGADTRA